MRTVLHFFLLNAYCYTTISGAVIDILGGNDNGNMMQVVENSSSNFEMSGGDKLTLNGHNIVGPLSGQDSSKEFSDIEFMYQNGIGGIAPDINDFNFDEVYNNLDCEAVCSQYSPGSAVLGDNLSKEGSTQPQNEKNENESQNSTSWIGIVYATVCACLYTSAPALKNNENPADEEGGKTEVSDKEAPVPKNTAEQLSNEEANVIANEEIKKFVVENEVVIEGNENDQPADDMSSDEFLSFSSSSTEENEEDASLDEMNKSRIVVNNIDEEAVADKLAIVVSNGSHEAFDDESKSADDSDSFEIEISDGEEENEEEKEQSWGQFFSDIWNRPTEVMNKLGKQSGLTMTLKDRKAEVRKFTRDFFRFLYKNPMPNAKYIPVCETFQVTYKKDSKGRIIWSSPGYKDCEHHTETTWYITENLFSRIYDMLWTTLALRMNQI